MVKYYSEDILRKAFEAGESYHAGKDFPYHGYKGKLPPDFDEWIKEVREQSVDTDPEKLRLGIVVKSVCDRCDGKPEDECKTLCDDCFQDLHGM